MLFLNDNIHFELIKDEIDIMNIYFYNHKGYDTIIESSLKHDLISFGFGQSNEIIIF